MFLSGRFSSKSDCDSCERRFVEASEIFCLEFVIAGNGHHGGIVGGEFSGRNPGADAEGIAKIGHRLSHTGIGRHAATDSHIANACDLDSFLELVEQDFDDGCLKLSAEVRLVFLDEIWIFFDCVAESVKKRCL